VVDIIEATQPEQVAQAKRLFIEYAEALGVDLCFQGFTEELAALPGDYVPPAGRLLLALEDGQPVGCVALHAYADLVCEIKRLYVQPGHRGQHIGRLLVQRVIDEARAAGYESMKLDTLKSLKEAGALYRSFGFVVCAPYRYNPLADVIFMELNLRPMQVFKVSGTDLDDTTFSNRFAAAMTQVVSTGARPIVIHGGGKELTALLNAFQIDSRFVDGLRVTDARTRDMALMTLSGLANKRLVAALLVAGTDAIGISGVDGGLVRVRKIDDALQYVGKPTHIRADLLKGWLGIGIVPVIAPMSLGEDGEIYNVNADHVAGAIAAALDATMLIFITNVKSVMAKDGSPIAELTSSEAEALIADGTISDGMIPKVRTALEALDGGVRNVRITDLNGVTGGYGTTFTHTN
jgi:acetylglutamate kinase